MARRALCARYAGPMRRRPAHACKAAQRTRRRADAMLAFTAMAYCALRAKPAPQSLTLWRQGCAFLEARGILSSAYAALGTMATVQTALLAGPATQIMQYRRINVLQAARAILLSANATKDTMAMEITVQLVRNVQ